MRTIFFSLVLCLAAACGKSTPPPAEPPGTQPPAAGGACMKTGCGGTLCAAEEQMSTCEFRPEHVCYKAATCERQADSQCGWTQTAELTACLANPPPA